MFVQTLLRILFLRYHLAVSGNAITTLEVKLLQEDVMACSVSKTHCQNVSLLLPELNNYDHLFFYVNPLDSGWELCYFLLKEYLHTYLSVQLFFFLNVPEAMIFIIKWVNLFLIDAWKLHTSNEFIMPKINWLDLSLSNYI